MGKMIVRYLDPNTKKYENATVADVGDLSKLTTAVKTDLVSAINALSISGGSGTAELNQKIEDINTQIDLIKTGGLTEKELAQLEAEIGKNLDAINNLIKDSETSLTLDFGNKLTAQATQLQEKLAAETAIINQKITDEKLLLQKDVDEKLAAARAETDTQIGNAKLDYDAKIADVNTAVDSAKTSIAATEAELTATKKKLANIDLDQTTLTQTVDKINGELINKVNSTEFDKVETTIAEHTTELIQNKKAIEAKASKDALDLATQRITKAEADIKLTSEGLESRVTKKEMHTELEKIERFGKNLIRNSRNYRGWNIPAGVSISSETFRHCQISTVTADSAFTTTELEDLKIGTTYTASVFAKVDNETESVKAMFYEQAANEMLCDFVDNNVKTGWQRFFVSFVAKAESQAISFRFKGLTSTNKGYFSAPKVEKGAENTDWQPHIDDDSERITETNTSLKQQSDRITTLAEKTEKIGEDLTVAKTSIDQTSESVKTQATKITELDGKITETNAQLEVANDKIGTKVSKTDVGEIIGQIHVDNKNRVLNSDFQRKFENWNNVNRLFTIETIENVDYVCVNRTGLTAPNVASLDSDKFYVQNGERLMIGFDLINVGTPSLDDDRLLTLELFDMKDIRVGSKTFRMAELKESGKNGLATRLAGIYTVDRPDAVKASIKLHLYKNGYIKFSRLSLQNGDIESTDWLPAPEDDRYIQAKLETSINQTADKVSFAATKADVNALTGRVDSATSRLDIAAGQIGSLVTKTDKTNEQVSSLEQTAGKIQTTIVDVQKNVDDMEIGGRNLCLNTADPQTIVGENKVGQVAEKRYKFSFGEIKNYDGKSKDPFIISFDWEATKGATGKFYPHFTNTPWTFGASNQFTGELSGRYIFAFKSSDEWKAGIANGIFIGLDNFSGSLTIKNFKFEKGNKATDWSPAPEDMATEEKVSKLEQTVDGFKTSVAKDYATKTEVNTDVSAANKKITETNQALARVNETVTTNQGKISQLEQNVDGFKTTVSADFAKKTDVNAVGVTANAAKTAADKANRSVDVINGQIVETNNKVTQLEQNVNGFKTTVSATYATKTDLGNTNQTVATTNSKVSQLEQNVNGFKTTVANNYASKVDLDNLEIGGRNLITNSESLPMMMYRPFTNKATSITSAPTPMDDGWQRFVLRVPGINNGTEILPNPDKPYDTQIGSTYTQSIEVRTDIKPIANAKGQWAWYFFDGTGHRYSDIIVRQLGETHYKLSSTFTVTGTKSQFPVLRTMDITNLHSIFPYHTQGTYLDFKNAKLEKGTKATDWSPAPEDTIVGGKNLLVESDSISGYVDGNGAVNPAPQACHQVMKTLTPVGSNDTLLYQLWNPKGIASSNTNRVAFFTNAQAFISYYTLPTLNGNSYQKAQIIPPPNAAFMRLGAIMGPTNGAKDPSIKVKFEIGTKPTDWSPAPEDTASEISQIKQTASEFSVELKNKLGDGKTITTLFRMENGKTLLRSDLIKLDGNVNVTGDFSAPKVVCDFKDVPSSVLYKGKDTGTASIANGRFVLDWTRKYENESQFAESLKNRLGFSGRTTMNWDGLKAYQCYKNGFIQRENSFTPEGIRLKKYDLVSGTIYNGADAFLDAEGLLDLHYKSSGWAFGTRLNDVITTDTCTGEDKVIAFPAYKCTEVKPTMKGLSNLVRPMYDAEQNWIGGFQFQQPGYYQVSFSATIELSDKAWGRYTFIALRQNGQVLNQAFGVNNGQAVLDCVVKIDKPMSDTVDFLLGMYGMQIRLWSVHGHVFFLRSLD